MRQSVRSFVRIFLDPLFYNGNQSWPDSIGILVGLVRARTFLDVHFYNVAISRLKEKVTSNCLQKYPLATDPVSLAFSFISFFLFSAMFTKWFGSTIEHGRTYNRKKVIR